MGVVTRRVAPGVYCVLCHHIMSFFSGLLGDHSPFGRNCQEVESDPKADPFEKLVFQLGLELGSFVFSFQPVSSHMNFFFFREICVTMRQFEESFSRFPGFGPPVEFGFEGSIHV